MTGPSVAYIVLGGFVVFVCPRLNFRCDDQAWRSHRSPVCLECVLMGIIPSVQLGIAPGQREGRYILTLSMTSDLEEIPSSFTSMKSFLEQRSGSSWDLTALEFLTHEPGALIRTPSPWKS